MQSYMLSKVDARKLLIIVTTCTAIFSDLFDYCFSLFELALKIKFKRHLT